MATAEALLTAEEYAKLPDDGRRTELVRGRIVEMNVPGIWHGYVCLKFGRILGNFVEDHDLGQAMSNDSGVITERGPDTVRGADFSYYSYARLPKGAAFTPGYASVVPELVVEVKSPDQRWRQLHAKAGEYLQAGVSVVWVADPKKQTVTVYESDDAPRVLDREAILTLPELLPGFAVPVARFFE